MRVPYPVCTAGCAPVIFAESSGVGRHHLAAFSQRSAGQVCRCLCRHTVVFYACSPYQDAADGVFRSACVFIGAMSWFWVRCGQVWVYRCMYGASVTTVGRSGRGELRRAPSCCGDNLVVVGMTPQGELLTLCSNLHVWRQPLPLCLAPAGCLARPCVCLYNPL